MIFIIASAAMLFVTIFSTILITDTNRMLLDSVSKQLTAAAQAASRITTAETLDSIAEEMDPFSSDFMHLKKALVRFATFNDCVYVYFVRVDPNDDYRQYYIMDNAYGELTDDLDTEGFASEEDTYNAARGVPSVRDLGEYSTNWEGLLTAWAPVVYKDERLSNYVVGVDISDDVLKSTRNNTTTVIVILIATMAVVLSSGAVGLFLFRKKAMQAESASVAKSDFLSRMSHEMRTPMNAIIGLSRMASESDDILEIKGYLTNVAISSQHLRHVIDDILDISKIESGKMTLEFRPTNIAAEIKEIETMIQPQMAEKKLKFVTSVDSAVPQYVLYDRTHVRQIVVNLLSNAMKFTPENGNITLSIVLNEIKDGVCDLRWSVKDDGIGIDAKNVSKLFNAFEQEDASTTRKYGGTGLGLAITKQLVEMMGGKIEVQSEKGKGSDFIFNIHLTITDEKPIDETVETSGDAPVLEGKTVLLVEDSEINQIVAENAFEKMGAVTVTANDGQQGYDRFAEDPLKYDIIFMDIQMPVMDGFTATKKIRTSGIVGADKIPIIAMTANVFKEDIDKSIESGMNDHVGKPFEPREIEDAVRRAFKAKSKI